MRDNHLHTYFSYDSEAIFWLSNRPWRAEITATEHHDLSNPYPHQAACPRHVPDSCAYSAKIAELNQQYGKIKNSWIEMVTMLHKADILVHS